MIKVEYTGNSDEIMAEMRRRAVRGLTACGLAGEGYAKKLCPVDTGTLRNSISYRVAEDEMAVYIGTDNEYANYVEHGTGKYAENGGGRPTPWVYQDAEGNWHWTEGNKAQPFIKPAVADHLGNYRNIINHELTGD